MRRRTFLQGMAGMAAGAALRPLWWPALARGGAASAAAAQGKILVMVVFQGGNDGVNTVIPYTDPLYPVLRPILRVPANEVLTLENGMGFHPSLAPLMPLWDAGKVGVVQGVGYPDMNLSHFRGTDIILSGSASDEVVNTGWLARWLEAENPSFPNELPPDPLALQQGFSARLPLGGERGTTGVVVNNPETFNAIVGLTYEGEFSDQVPATPGGDELAFMRRVDVESFEYAQVIQAAAEGGTNTGAYPNGNFAGQLGTIARLIEGGLDTAVFLAARGGFDTHGGQLGAHPVLLDEFAQTVAAFQEDLDRIGRADDVMILTVSEFGRRVEENGAQGTDHGTAAPWFVIGNGVQGGLHGAPPPLDSLDDYGNLLVQTDYRSVYASVLGDWFGADSDVVNGVLDGDYSGLSLVSSPAAPNLPAGDGDGDGGGVGATLPAAMRLHAPMPNPGSGPRVLRYALPSGGNVDLSVFDVRGRKVARVVEGTMPAGTHQTTWDPGALVSGVYFAVLRAGGQREVQKLVVR